MLEGAEGLRDRGIFGQYAWVAPIFAYASSRLWPDGAWRFGERQALFPFGAAAHGWKARRGGRRERTRKAFSQVKYEFPPWFSESLQECVGSVAVVCGLCGSLFRVNVL